MSKKRTNVRRALHAAWRDTSLLLRDFRIPLALFAFTMTGGGLILFELAALAGEPIHGRAEAIYRLFMMTFLQSYGSFPRAWYLQALYFIMPIIGIGIVAQGLADFGTMLFNRRNRSKEWEMAVASTFSHHIILVGLGHLGYRVVRQLREMDQEVVVIELDPEAELVANVRALDVPVIQGDGTRESTLAAAGVREARIILLCTQNDSLNMQIAVKARSMQPAIQVVMRIFDEDFAGALNKQFGFCALSATGMAAPIFAATAAGMDMTQPITVEGRALSLARLNVSSRSKLANITVGQVEQTYDVSVVLLRHDGQTDLHPPSGQCLQPQDALAILGGAEQIKRLVQDNR